LGIRRNTVAEATDLSIRERQTAERILEMITCDYSHSQDMALKP